jgi:nucleotide-binding universal stress UspA family protein
MVKIANILVATDFSEAADSALEYARTFAARSKRPSSFAAWQRGGTSPPNRQLPGDDRPSARAFTIAV